MRFIIFVMMFLTLACGDIEMGKPTRLLTWTAVGHTTDPLNQGLTGLAVDEIASSEKTNWIYANITEWQDYLDRLFAKTYYIDRATGSDDNDGTKAYPFLSITKGIDTAEKYGETILSFESSGDYDINENMGCVDKVIIFKSAADITAKVRFISYLETTNKLYGINVKRSKLIFAMSDGVYVSGPVNSGVAWSSTQAICFYISEGESEIIINNKIDFSDLSAASGKSLLIKQAYSSGYTKGIGKTKLSVYGNITTNGNGQIIDTSGGLAEINYFGTMDRADLWVLNGVDKTYITALNTVMDFDNSAFPWPTVTLSAKASSKIIDAGDSEAVRLTKIKAFITEAYPDIIADDITAVVDILTGDIIGMEITISGASVTVPFIPVVGYNVNGNQQYMNLISQGRESVIIKNINILTNITAIK